MKRFLLAQVFLLVWWLSATACFAQDPNLHIYLAFGQSNMAGQSPITKKDLVQDPRFLVLRTAEHSGQSIGEFYPAVPPLGHSGTRVGILDFFGRAMVKALPDSIKVAVATVALGGQSIDMFDKDRYEEYVQKATSTGSDWWVPYFEEYGSNPYKRLVEVGKIAKTKGVIKGILFHQGEADAYRGDWPTRVKKVYNDLMTDLQLDSTKVPFLMGEFVSTEEGGQMGWRNSTVATVASMIPNGHLISSKSCPAIYEPLAILHFSREGYEILGKRYAALMLRLLDKPNAPRKKTSSRSPISMRLSGRDIEIIGAPDEARVTLYDMQGHLLDVLGSKGGILPPTVMGRTLVVVELPRSRRILTKFMFFAK